MTTMRTILHPTDFSESSRHAFETACALARDHQAKLLILHVMMPSVSPVQDASLPDPDRPAESRPGHADFPWPRPSGVGIPFEHRLAEGDAADEILRLAAASQSDVIVMGSHGRTGLSRLLTGSVAETVLRGAPCPVLIVKSPAAAGTRTDTNAHPGDLIDLRPGTDPSGSARARTLLRTHSLELVRLIVRGGEEIPTRTAAGEVVVQCLEGRVALTILGSTREIDAGTLVVVPAGEPHALRAVEDANLLLTFIADR